MQGFTVSREFFYPVYLRVTSELSEKWVFQSSGFTAIINLRSSGGKLRHTFGDDFETTTLHFSHITDY